MSFAPRSAGCFATSSISPPSSARAATTSACSSTPTADCPRVEAALARIPGGLTLGVAAAPIHRNPGFNDLVAMARFSAYLRRAAPDIVHGHGSKGGLYARLERADQSRRRRCAPTRRTAAASTTAAAPPCNRAYMLAERALAPLTDLFLFESAYIAGRFDAQVGARNGVRGASSPTASARLSSRR